MTAFQELICDEQDCSFIGDSLDSNEVRVHASMCGVVVVYSLRCNHELTLAVMIGLPEMSAHLSFPTTLVLYRINSLITNGKVTSIG